MTILLLAEHDNASLKAATLNVVTAATAIGGEVHMLVAGQNCRRPAAEAAAKIPGIAKVLVADDAAYANFLAENVAPLIVKLVRDNGYTHVLAHFKQDERFVEHDFSIFNEVLIERRASHNDSIVACTAFRNLSAAGP